MNDIEKIEARLDVNETAFQKLLDVLGDICTCHPAISKYSTDHREYCISEQIKKLTRSDNGDYQS